MSKLNFRYFIVAVMLIVTSSFVSALQYETSKDEMAGNSNLQKIPMQIGKWTGHDVHLDLSVYDILETRNIIHRKYFDDHGNTVLLSIVYYHDTKVDFHAPEACLGGRGARTQKHTKNIVYSIKDNLYTVEIAKITAKSASSETISYYFYKAGDFLGQNYIKMRLNLAKNSLFQKDKSGSLIRFSVVIDSLNDRETAEKYLNSFIKNVMPLIM